ncbi:MIF domain-containing protein [Histoplasma ohiense]|nr:MIF domain-containing protein [Histoplasma ohiense (nom. inval.)]
MASPARSHTGCISDPTPMEKVPTLVPLTSVQSNPVESDRPVTPKPSRRLRKAPGKGHESSNSITKELTRGAPTDGYPNRFLTKSSSQLDIAKKRSQYFNEVFTSREAYHTPRHRVNQDSVVVVEIKTNVLLVNDFQNLSELSLNLSLIFQRPESSILLYVEHNCCLMLASSYEPAYLVTVSALPCSIAPITNLRHTVLIQTAILDIFNIPGNRGVIKFESMAEENFATNGSTIRDEIDQLQRTSNDDHSIFKSISHSVTRKIKSNTSNGNSGVVRPGTPVHDLPNPSSNDGNNGNKNYGENNLASPAVPPEDKMELASPKQGVLRGRDRVIKKCQSIRQLFFH